MELVILLVILLMGESFATLDEDLVILENFSLTDLNVSTIQCTNLCAHSLQVSTLGIFGCYSNCDQEVESVDRPTPNGEFLLSLDLLCQTHEMMILKITDLPNRETTNFGLPGLYVLEAKSTSHSMVYLTASPTITASDLQPHTEYVFSGFVLSRTNRLEMILDAHFSTLQWNSEPTSVTNISIASYHVLHGDDLTVDINWELPIQRGCFYQALWHADDDEFPPRQRKITISTDGLQALSLTELRFGTGYKLAIRGLSAAQDAHLEGPLIWMDINTPSCLEWSGYDLEQCPPATPERLNITEVVFLPLKDHYDIQVTWKAPKVSPQNYTIQLIDMDIDMGEGPGHQIYSANISMGNTTTYEFTSMALFGSHFEVVLVAHSPGGSSHEAFVTKFFDKPTMTPNQRLLGDVQVLILILLPMAVLAGVSLFGYHVYLKRRKSFEFEDACLYTSGAPGYDAHCDPRVMLPIDDHMEKPLEDIKLLGDLGEGEFGLVKLGSLKIRGDASQVAEQTVAIKMLKASAKLEEMLEFRREIDMMKSVGAHKFIVSIVGHYTQNVNEMMLLTEYCPQGNLLNYLRATWRTINSSEAIYQEVEAGTAVENKCYQMTMAPLSHIDALHMSLQIASGMEYLSKNRVIHRDLAARNVLLCDDRLVKIADFGLSRDIYQNNVYRKKSKGKLPIKWMAIESLSHQIYTSQSDVWSYGILLYELVTYGSVPYASVPNESVLELLNTGFRMERPENCDEFLYDLMKACWSASPNNRPQFSSIVYQLQKMLEAEGGEATI